jgi:mRNA interferase RelE/StbE
MSHVQVILSPQATRDLKRLDHQDVSCVLVKIEENTQLPDPLVRAKALTGNLTGLYRYRVGDYRVVFAVTQDNIIAIYTVLTIKHRKDVYRQG